MNTKPKKVFLNMNATMEPKQKEPYEAPAVLDISPVTVVSVAGNSADDNVGDFDLGDGG